jgi:hypothetical protein
MVAVAIAGAGLVGAGASIYSSSKAADAQREGIAASTAAQQKAFDEQKALNAPFREGGITAQNRLLTVLGLRPAEGAGLTVDPNDPSFGKYGRDFGMADFEADPGYAFRIKEGMKGLQNSAAARGLLSSGSTLKGITDYGQNAASQEYGNAYQRYQTNRANQLNPLTGILGMGQTATNNTSAAAGQLGQGLAEGAAALGSANASSYINTGNALTNALNTGVNSYMGYNNMQAYNARTAAMNAGGQTPISGYY